MKVEETASQRIQELEALIGEYRSTVKKLEKDTEGLGGDPGAIGGRGLQQLQEELEKEKAAKLGTEKGLHFLVSNYS